GAAIITAWGAARATCVCGLIDLLRNREVPTLKPDATNSRVAVRSRRRSLDSHGIEAYCSFPHNRAWMTERGSSAIRTTQDHPPGTHRSHVAPSEHRLH